jgi:hypothetical protein
MMIWLREGDVRGNTFLAVALMGFAALDAQATTIFF